MKSLRDEIRLRREIRTDFISSEAKRKISSAQQISSLREQGFRSIMQPHHLTDPY